MLTIQAFGHLIISNLSLSLLYFLRIIISTSERGVDRLR